MAENILMSLSSDCLTRVNINFYLNENESEISESNEHNLIVQRKSSLSISDFIHMSLYK